MQIIRLSVPVLVCLSLMLAACSKSEAVQPVVEPAVSIQLQFLQDTIPIILTHTSCRKEVIGALASITLQGQYPDTILKPNRITLRVIGDSARTYRNSEIIASYTDSTGMAFSSSSDVTDSVVITKLEKTNNGLVTGKFSITVHNALGTKSYALRQGSFTTRFSD